MTKGERYTPSSGFKALERKLRTLYKCVVNKDEITADNLRGCAAIVFGAPKVKFEPNEILAIKEFMMAGGGVLLTAVEGSEAENVSFLNKFTQDYGISINRDCVVRTVYQKEYFHPKEAYIKDCSLNRAFSDACGKKAASSSSSSYFDSASAKSEDSALTICYPYGASLSLSRPALPLISSGLLAFPASRALCAAIKPGKGWLAVLGSSAIFDDQNIAKLDNAALAQGIFKLITTPGMPLDQIDPDRPEYGERVEVPDVEALAERLRSCLEETDELPADFRELFDHELFKFDSNHIPATIKLFHDVNVKHETLRLIPPQFEVPLPPLQPAVFLPTFREPPPPALELMDLDEYLASDKSKLAQLTNKCTDIDLDYFVREAGEILGITDKIKTEKGIPLGGAAPAPETKEGKESKDDKPPPPVVTANEILEYLLKKLVNYKKIDQSDNQPPAKSSIKR